MRGVARPGRAHATVLALVVGGCAAPPGDRTLRAPAEDRSACAAPAPGRAPIRRLNGFEYARTIRDLLGPEAAGDVLLAPDEQALGFDNQARALTLTTLRAEQYMHGAEAIAARAITDLDRLLAGCDVVARGEPACADEFISRFGARAFRRPLTPAEHRRHRALYEWGRNGFDFATGIQLVVEAMLQSPSFLYRVEIGMPSSQPESSQSEVAIVELTQWELASRLSYLLWATMPDDALFAAAARNELATAAGIEVHARRMLAAPAARDAVARFHLQWLELGRLSAIADDPSLAGQLDDARVAALSTEVALSTSRTVLDANGDVAALFITPYQEVGAGPHADGGILTLPGVLAAHALGGRASALHRGRFIRERLLCQLVPPPPEVVVSATPTSGPIIDARAGFAAHAQNPACVGCHRLMEPLGFAFEGYDALGRLRPSAAETGAAVDVRGAIFGSRDVDGAFDGPADLARRLAGSEQVRDCVVRQWFRYGYGRVEAEDDRCTVARLEQRFAEGDYRIEELVVALTQTDAFRYRAVVPEDR